MRILYVEDNETNQALVERVMRAKQHKVVFCEEGEAALDMLAGDPDISLILLDIELAGSMSGVDVITTLRNRGDTRPVVAVTAYAMMGDRERILDAGCDQYLPKPLVITDLLTILDHYESELSGTKPVAEAIPAPQAVAHSGNGTKPTPSETPAAPVTPAPSAESPTPPPAPTPPAPPAAPQAAAPAVAASAPSAAPGDPVPATTPDATPATEPESTPAAESVAASGAAPAVAAAPTPEASDASAPATPEPAPKEPSA